MKLLWSSALVQVVIDPIGKWLTMPVPWRAFFCVLGTWCQLYDFLLDLDEDPSDSDSFASCLHDPTGLGHSQITDTLIQHFTMIKELDGNGLSLSYNWHTHTLRHLLLYLPSMWLVCYTNHGEYLQTPSDLAWCLILHNTSFKGVDVIMKGNNQLSRLCHHSINHHFGYKAKTSWQ